MTIKILCGSEEMPLNAIRLCGMGVVPSRILNMSESLYITINYSLRDKYEDLESKFYD